MKAISFLDAVAGYTNAGPVNSSGRPIKLAIVDPAYDPFVDWPDQPPPARVTFEGETTLSTKAYAIAGGLLPMPGTRVFLVPIGNSYLIAGTLGTLTSQGFWQSEDGLDSGVEFGSGSYYNDTDGLVVAGDAAFTGDVTVDGGDLGKGNYMVAQSSSNSGNFTTTLTVMLTLTDVVFAPGRCYEFSFGNKVLLGTAGYVNVAARRVTPSSFGAEWGFCPINVASVDMQCQGSQGYVANTGVSPITADWELVMAAQAGTGSQRGAANRKRFFQVRDVGRADEYPQATTYTS